MGKIYRFYDAVLDTGTGRVVRGAETLALEPRTYEVLLHFVERPGELVRHSDLLDRVWVSTNVTAHSLTQAISQLRQTFDDDPRQPKFIETVHRRGYRWVAPVTVSDAPPLPDDLPSAAPRWTVPARWTELIGRDDLVERVADTAGQERLVVLIGPGGVGKTQLALEVARRATEAFDHGSLFVDMTSENDMSGITRALARALRIPVVDRTATLGGITVAMRDRNVLIVLDGCEHVVDAISTMAAELIGSCRGVHVLLTTQRPVRAPGQVLIRVPPLESPPADWTPQFSAATDWPASVRLFIARATSTNPDFLLTSRNSEAVAQICRHLDGIPLALELAAARTNVLTPEQIAERLDERFGLLLSKRFAAVPRHRTLHATIAWSVSLLSAGSHRLLQRLVVFSGGWTFEAAEAIAGHQSSANLIDELADLVDRSLVAADVDRPHARYRMLDSIRLYAQKPIASDVLAETRQRHFEYFGRFADKLEHGVSADPLVWLRRAREEYANLRDAFRWAVSSEGHSEDALELCCNLRSIWRLEGNYVESHEWLMQALQAAPNARPALAGRAWIILGLIQHHRNEMADARASVHRGLDRLPADARADRAFGLVLLAFIETLAGSLEEAEVLAVRAQQEVDTVADDQLTGFALMRAGVAAGLRNRHDEAVSLLTQAVMHLGGGRDPFLFMFTKVQLGLQAFLKGDILRARETAEESLRAACEYDNLRGIAGNLELLGYLSVDTDPKGACLLLGAATRLRDITAAPMQSNFIEAHRRAHDAVMRHVGPTIAAREMEVGASMRLSEVLGVALG
ncbi:MAG: winged helix-turn-helix domain-containing protein [Acidobacteriota bacterium]|nr:winged helix-turn-helix domain-containing protein [Acidobacteriota bacterium]